MSALWRGRNQRKALVRTLGLFRRLGSVSLLDFRTLLEKRSMPASLNLPKAALVERAHAEMQSRT